jgi:PKD repeat protein
MSWSVPGVYDIVLKVSNPCGESIDTFKIVVIEPPVAKATVDDNAGCAPFRPKFDNSSTGHKEYLWEVMPDSGYTFINGTNGKSWEPEISFNIGGSYRVVLYVSNTCRTDSVVFNFNVFTRPDGRIENLDNICITHPLIHPSVVYNNNGSPVKLFNWTFTGGTPSISYAEDPGIHTYSAPGEYSVNLVLENECGSFNISEIFHVYPMPEVTVNTPVSSVNQII